MGASTLAARRWGLGLGGLVSAFPAIVGPLLLKGAVAVQAATARASALRLEGVPA